VIAESRMDIAVPAALVGVSGAAAPPAGIRRLLADYLSLAKPRIMSLLLVTELGTMVAAARGWPGTWLTLVALVGGACSSGGASAINCWFDRDIDARMARTCTRPVPAGRIQPGHALLFGVGLGAIGFVVLALGANLLAAVLALTGGLFYVLVYTVWLKRLTPQNIVIGGAAGAFPPLVGGAVVTHSVTPLAMALFAVIFFWTPPHFWSLALLLRQQYREVAVPMLPVVADNERTARSIVAYSLVMVGVSLVPAIWLGPVYAVGSLLLGAVFVLLGVRGLSATGLVWASRLFHYSLLYLALIFTLAAMAAVTPLLATPRPAAFRVTVSGGPARVGATAPDFSTHSLDGATVRLSQFHGKPVLLNFWATWCTACEAEMPGFQRAAALYRSQGLTPLAVNYRETNTAEMRSFMTGLGARFPAVYDPDGLIAAAYGVDIGLPVSVFIDRAGRVTFIQVGQMSSPLLQSRLHSIL
jgi:heme o synthase